MYYAVGLLALAAVWAWRRTYIRAIELRISKRLPLDPNGIIVGAEPISLDAPGKNAVLLLHGGADTPQTMHYVAEAFHARGYTVRVPLLAGHGRTLVELGRLTADQLADTVARDYAALRASHPCTSIVALSLGGALAVPLAAHEPTLHALVLIAPYLAVPRSVRILAAWSWLWGPLVPYLRIARPGSLRDPDERPKNLGFGHLPASAFGIIHTTVRRAVAALPRVHVPTLVIQSRNDNRITTDACRAAYALLGAPDKRLELLDEGGHIITVDYGREHVIRMAIDWIESHRS